MTGWRDRAACAGRTVLFDLADALGRGAPVAAARALCGSCPVRRDCLTEAMDFEDGLSEHQRHGIWGGLRPAERAALAPSASIVLASSTSAPHG